MRTILGAIGICLVLMTTLAAATAVHSNAPNPPSPFTAQQLAREKAAEEQAARDKWKVIEDAGEAARKQVERELGLICPPHHDLKGLDLLMKMNGTMALSPPCKLAPVETHRPTSPGTDI